MKELTTIKAIAECIKEAGGRAYLVGGCVRDELLGYTPKDFDIEVYSLEPAKLKELLQEFGKVDAVGESFAVYKVGQNIDVSLPRREKKVGKGHKGFIVEGDPRMSFAEACLRRDFTINAIMKDILSDEIIDPYHGRNDLKNGIIKAVSSLTFQEDSLRVLRLVQFTARFGFEVELATAELARKVSLKDLPKERIWMELEKMITKSSNPFIGFRLMYMLGVTEQLIPNAKIGLRDGMWEALYNLPKFAEELEDGEKCAVYLATFLSESDIFNTCEEELESLGVSSLNGFSVFEQTIALLAMFKSLGISKIAAAEDWMLTGWAKIWERNLRMKLLAMMVGAFNEEAYLPLANRIKELGIENKPVPAILKGRHLIELGLKPSPVFRDILDEVYDAQLRNFITDEEEAKTYVIRKIAENEKQDNRSNWQRGI